jgi:prepilin-type N-terminal cleavage/methylation domain-containing protein
MTERRGFSLPEVLLSLLVLAIVGGAIHDGLRRQQQVFRSIALMVAVRGDARDAAEVLAADLAMTSPSDTLPLVADSAVEFYSAIGASVTCDSAPGYTIRLPPEKLTGGRRLTALLATPDSGDLLLVFNDESAAPGGDPRWDRHTIESVSSAPAYAACPPSTGFTTPADAAASSQIITLRAAASSALRAGAPVRILRRVRYSLYRSSDAKWYLGSRRCSSLGVSACGVIQPLSGPYAAYSGGAGASGIELRYFDGRGVRLAPGASTQVARVEITARGKSSRPVYRARALSDAYVDSAALSIALRNRD